MSNYTNANGKGKRTKNRKITFENFNTIDPTNKERSLKRPVSAANFLTNNQRF